MQTALYYLGLACLFTHELDAVTHSEWQLLYLLRGLPDREASTVFVLLHVPLFFGILWLSHHRRDRVRNASRNAVALFLGVHAALHLLQSSAPANDFQGPLSITLIAAAGGFGIAYLVVRWRAGSLVASSLAGLLLAGVSAQGATLPPHPALRILIVSDEVNPHGLSDADLTQPGDISVALLAAGNGLNLDGAPDAVVEIATDDVSTATALLSVPIDSASAYDVVIYFAHRIPSGPSGAQDQEDFVDALEAFLVAGGGLISFHHGSYTGAGKASIQEIIGATASGSVPWNTIDGQDVINVVPSHFVTGNEVEYPSSVVYADAARGVPSSVYDFFNNTPDERYLTFDINPTAGSFTVLFASNYDQSGTTHLLGFEHRRPEWAGVVIGYQPGEYQPNALDDLDGNNFQILANAIVYAAYVEPTQAVPALPPLARGLLAAGLLLCIGLATTRRASG